MEYRVASEALSGDIDMIQELSLEWDERRLYALLQRWPWIHYAVVWNLTPDKRALVWNTGYIRNDHRSLQQVHHGLASSDTRLEILANIFYPIYKSCKFTSPSSGYAARAFSQQLPLWWTSNSPRFPTDQRKDKFLQQAGIQTIVCLPGPRISNGHTLYCLELASTALIMEASQTVDAIQAFMFGSSTLPGSLSFDSNLPGFSFEERLGGDAERILSAGVQPTTSREHLSAAALALIPRFADTNLRSDNCFRPGPQACNPSAEPACDSSSLLNRFEALSEAAHVMGPAAWFNEQIKFSAAEAVQLAFATDDHVPTSIVGAGAVRDEEMSSLRPAAQDGAPPLQMEMPNRTAASSDLVGVSTTDRMLNLWAAMNADIDETQMPGISSIIQRSTFDSLATAFEIMDHPAKAFAAVAADQQMSVTTVTSFDDVVVAGHNSTGGPYDDQELAFHLLNQSTSAAASRDPYEIMYCIESPAASIHASVAAEAPSVIRQGGTLAASDALRILADLGGDSSSPRASGIGDQVMDIAAGASTASDYERGQVSDHNPFQPEQQWTSSSKSMSRKLSPFEPLDPSRNSKHRRFNDSLRDVEMITAHEPVCPAPCEQPMIELLNLNPARITESADRIIMQRRLAAPDEQLGAARIGRSTMNPAPVMEASSSALAELNFGLGWNQEDQANIAYNHKMAERDRRSKFNDKFQILSTIVPVTKKKDKLSILTNTIEYIHKLKDQIAAKAEKAGSSQTHQPAVQAPATEPAGGAPSRVTADSVLEPLRGSLATAPVIASSGTTQGNTTTDSAGTVAVRIESGADQAAARDFPVPGAASDLVPASRLAIQVESSSNNPDILIQILNVVQELRLEMGPLSSKLIHDRTHISLSVLVPSNLPQTMSWYCNEMQKLVEKVFRNPVSLPLVDSSQSDDSEPELDTMTIQSKSV